MNFTSSIFLILLLHLHTFESPIMSLYAQMQLFSLLCMYGFSLILTKIPFSSCFGLVFYLYFTLIWFLSDFYPGFYFETLLCQWDLEISDRLFRLQCSFCTYQGVTNWDGDVIDDDDDDDDDDQTSND